MIVDFKKTIDIIKISAKSKILIAVSGGIDSMVLLDLFNNYHHNYAIAHCNFSLRGEESNIDQEFVENSAKSLNIKCFTKTFDTNSYAKKNKISTQMAARNLRYSWFKKICKKYNFDFIATAHHLNDSVETVLFNLIRGSGLSGLHGIKALDGSIMRPLINMHKHDLIRYANDNNLEFREDSSNSQNKYSRNKIRNQIIPIMKEINPSVISSIGKTISKITAVEEIYNEYILFKKEKLVIRINDEFIIDIKKLLKEKSSKQLLYEFISDFGFSDLDGVFNSLLSNSGKEFFNDRFYMVKDRDKLIISQHIYNKNNIINHETRIVKEPFKIEFDFGFYSDFLMQNKAKNTMLIDYNRLEFPLLIRSWKEGDRFIPLGMKGYKKLSDYFIDNKYSLIEKKKARVLISGEKVVCIIGDRLDDRFKLVETSEKVYIVTI